MVTMQRLDLAEAQPTGEELAAKSRIRCFVLAALVGMISALIVSGVLTFVTSAIITAVAGKEPMPLLPAMRYRSVPVYEHTIKGLPRRGVQVPTRAVARVYTISTIGTASPSPSPSPSAAASSDPPALAPAEKIIPVSALNYDTIQYVDDYDLAHKGQEYNFAGPIQKRSVPTTEEDSTLNMDNPKITKRAKIAWTPGGLLKGHTKLPACMLDKYPSLVEKGAYVGMEVEERKTLFWPVECKCYNSVDGRVEYHVPSRLVVGCLREVEC